MKPGERADRIHQHLDRVGLAYREARTAIAKLCEVLTREELALYNHERRSLAKALLTLREIEDCLDKEFEFKFLRDLERDTF